jgi:hypothetical protein
VWVRPHTAYPHTVHHPDPPSVPEHAAPYKVMSRECEGVGRSTYIVNNMSTFVFEEGFDGVPVRNNATYRDGRGARCVHELRYDQFDLHGAAHGRGFRIVTAPGHERGCEPDQCEIRDQGYLAGHPTLLGFDSYYVDTLNGQITEPWHNIGQGAFVGVEELPHGEQAFALRAEGVTGLVIVCTKPIVLSAATSEAFARVYVANDGWTVPEEELRVWADVGAPGGGISLLPNCTTGATRENIDALGLRSRTSNSTATDTPVSAIDPEWARGNTWRDDVWALMQLRLSQDDFAWRDLSVSLGRLEAAETRVCVGLQSNGIGSTTVFVDHLQLSGGGTSDGAPTEQGCAPDAQLVGMSSLSELAVPGSCGLLFDNPVAQGFLAVLLALLGMVGLRHCCVCMRERARARWPRKLAVEVTSPRPFA